MTKAVFGAIAALAFTASPAQAALLYAVDETNNLVSFNSATPGTTLSSVAIMGVTGSSILAMDIRPSTNILYALTDDYRLFTVNRMSGATSLVSTLALSGTNFAFDFNPTNNNLRIVSNDNSNYVYNFVTNMLVPGITVAYGAGDPNFGANPDITAAGYLNNDQNPATGTTLFVLDSLNDVLATQNAATGVLTTRGPLGVDIGSRTSFDVFTSGPINQTFALNGNQLYSLNTGTGALTLIGNTDRTLFALAASPVPEPATWAMMIVGFGVVGAGMRRRVAKDGQATANA